MKEINRVRRSEGLNDMKVSLPAVAAAILHTNWSAYHGDHAGFHGYNGPGGNENLAWGYGTDPVWGWFYVEKMVASAQGKLKLSDEDYNHIISVTDDTVNTKEDVDAWAKELAEENPETGHYGNIILGRRPDAIGAAAYNNDPKGSYYGDTSGMEITSDYSGSLDGFIYDETDYKNGHYDGDEKSPVSLGKMSLEDYEKLLNQYLDTLDTKKLVQQIDALKAEKQSLEQQADDLLKGTAAEKAKKALDEAKTALESAKNAEEAAKKDAEAKATEAETAQQAATKAEEALSQKNADLAKAKENLASAKADLQDAQVARDAQKAKTAEAASKASTAEDTLGKAQEQLAAASQGKQAAEQKLSEAKTALENAQKAYDKAASDAQQKAEAYANAQQKAKDAQKAYESASADAKKANDAYTAAAKEAEATEKASEAAQKALQKRQEIEKSLADARNALVALASEKDTIAKAQKENDADVTEKRTAYENAKKQAMPALRMLKAWEEIKKGGRSLDGIDPQFDSLKSMMTDYIAMRDETEEAGNDYLEAKAKADEARSAYAKASGELESKKRLRKGIRRA